MEGSHLFRKFKIFLEMAILGGFRGPSIEIRNQRMKIKKIGWVLDFFEPKSV